MSTRQGTLGAKLARYRPRSGRKRYAPLDPTPDQDTFPGHSTVTCAYMAYGGVDGLKGAVLGPKGRIYDNRPEEQLLGVGDKRDVPCRSLSQSSDHPRAHQRAGRLDSTPPHRYTAQGCNHSTRLQLRERGCWRGEVVTHNRHHHLYP